MRARAVFGRRAKGVLTSKVKLGADASAAAGHKGRDAAAETDATLRAGILSYSRARGAFAGISLEGSTLRPDCGANKNLYGKEVAAGGHRDERRSSPAQRQRTTRDSERQVSQE